MLTYNEYTAHLSLEVLLLFRTNRIVVYALPANTSGKTQPLDLVAFSAYKRELNPAIARTVGTGMKAHVDMYEYCQILTTAYYKAFTHSNITSSFMRSGMWPLRP